MENASKALIMAAEILIGVMIISVGVYLFSVFADYSKEASDKRTTAQIAEFNNQFLKYYGERTINDKGDKEPIKCTIHDIASLANLAKRNNTYHELLEQNTYSDNTLYIQIDVKNNSTIQNKKNIEKYDEQELIDLIKNNDIISSEDESGQMVPIIKYYKCSEYKISTITKRVMYLKFEEI